ncbi:demeter-like 1 [Striga asiatica]|uniref:Demeter-like 1 n=1 Tax=Striga asiatica TaxID=4170 RepID=A0A5A7QYH0_STRAF|nr:demeter-like 1 [Striga asiatica]
MPYVGAVTKSVSETSAKSSEGPHNVLVYTRKKYSNKPSVPQNVLVYMRKKYAKKPTGHEKLKGIVVAKRVKVAVLKIKQRKISTGKFDSWKDPTESESLLERVESFVSSIRPIQGEMKFCKWKGSVLDSIMGAYLTQNVKDTFSSSAFISLASKYPIKAAQVHSPPDETFKMVLRSSRSKVKIDEEMLPSWKMKRPRTAEFGRKNRALKGKAVCAKDSCSEVEKGGKIENDEVLTRMHSWKIKKNRTNGMEKRALITRKRKMSEDGWDALKKCYMVEDEFGDNAYDNDSSDALDWKAVQAAKVDEIAKAIKNRGMSNNLATRIKNCLTMLETNLGRLNLEWMKGVPDNTAREYLLRIPGLGLKSVECVRLLSLSQKAFPIDRNAGRIAVRLGWVPIQPLPQGQGQEFHQLEEYPKPDSVQDYLWPQLSQLDVPTLYELHCQMITFGKVFCTKKNPNCNACPMKAECRHYASARHSSNIFEDRGESSTVNEKAMLPIQCVFPKRPQGSGKLKSHEALVWDLEDFGIEKISEIKADENIEKSAQEGEISKALMFLNTKSSVYVPVSNKLKNAVYLRTEHRVYELPDSHCVLAKLEKRVFDDSCPYLLAIWPNENPDKEDTVYGTLVLPARTAMRGKFPLNGTYFQANEVFADDESCEFPIKVSKASISNLPCTTLYCGNDVSTICKGMKAHEVRKCFREGYICLRRFNRKNRESKPLSARFYFQAKPSNQVTQR